MLVVHGVASFSHFMFFQFQLRQYRQCAIHHYRPLTIYTYISVYPGAGTDRCNDGTWPLWNALRPTTDVAVLRDLIVSFPTSVELTGPNDCTILHRALEKDICTTILKDIIKACPKILQKKDSEGRLPLHYAIERRAKLGVMELLVKKCPATVDMENAKGETPFKMADRIGLPEDTVEFLNPFVEVDA